MKLGRISGKEQLPPASKKEGAAFLTVEETEGDTRTKRLPLTVGGGALIKSYLKPTQPLGFATKLAAQVEREMATHSSILAWRIPGTEEPGGLLSVGSYRVRHD